MVWFVPVHFFSSAQMPIRVCAASVAAVPPMSLCGFERVKLARVSGLPLTEPPPSRASELFRTNHSVRRAGEMEWHIAGSAGGREIMSEWQSWRGSGGEAAAVCLP